jgi:hypothetical protein
VATDPATGITRTAATVAGRVNPNIRATTYHFEYGPTPSYGTSTPEQPVGAGTAAIPVSAAIGGLRPATTYHYRIVATNAEGTSATGDATFVTAALADTTAPVLDKLAVSPRSFAVGISPTATTAATGSKITFTLSEAATVQLAVQRATAGLELTGKGKKTTCVAATKKNRTNVKAQIRKRLGSKASKKQIAAALRKASCALFVTRGTLRRSGKPGANSVPFSGRIGSKALAKGAYRVLGFATDAARNRSGARTASFAVVAAKKKKKR